MRIFTASIATESNSFSPIPTNLDSYKDCFYAAPGEHPDRPTPSTSPLYILRREAKAKGWTVIEGTCCFTEPSGPTTRTAYETLRDEVLAQLKAALPVDAVIMGLHGAMIADGYDDCEGDLMTRMRALIGPKAKMGVELDPHCHLTQAMMAAADVMICYKEFPHTDYVERAEELVKITADAVAGRVKPVMSLFDCQMIGSYPTSRQPMRGFVDRMSALEGKDKVLSISAVHCFPYGDVEEIGTKMLVVADGDQGKADSLARELGVELYRLRGTTMPTFLTIDQAIDAALAKEGGPFVVADPADNAGGGAPSDNTSFLRRLIERNVDRASVGPIWDPQSVRFCFKAGEGARIDLRIGGKTGRFSSTPVDAKVEVIKCVPDATMTLASGVVVRMGDSVGVRILEGGGGVTVSLVTQRCQAWSPQLFSNVGIDPKAQKMLAVKSTNHFYAAFSPIAKEVLYVETDGPLPRDHRKVPYTKIKRPMWPFVEDPLRLNS